MKPRPHEYLLALILLACIVYVIVGCAGLMSTWNTISGHLLQIAFGIGAAIVVAIIAGIPILPAIGAGAAASTITILAQPPCSPAQGGPPTAMLYGMPYWVWFIIGYAVSLAIRNRHWLPFFFSKQAKGYRLRLLIHFILGGKPPVIPPQFLPDAASAP